MLTVKLKSSLFLLFLLVTKITLAKTPVEEYGRLSVSGKYVVDSAGNPVQLTGMSLYWSQWQGKYYTYNTIKWLRDDWKCTVVRAAMGVQSGGYMTSPTAEKQKVKTVVQAAIDLGIYVIIDWHSSSALDAAERVKAAAFFAEMAKTYAAYPNVIYETFNEPLNVAWADLKVYHQTVIDSIRKYDTTNIVVCGTSNWSQDVDKVVGNNLPGKNIAYTLHYYAATHKESLRAKAVTAINAGLCLFVTEFGTCAADGGDPIDKESAKTWFNFLDTNKISWCNWSVADVSEAASIIYSGASVNGGWTSSQITPSGKIIRNELLLKYNLKNMTTESAPIIVSQPENASIGTGQSYTISIEAISPDTLMYQWYFNNQEIADANENSYAIDSFSAADTGKYYVKITNSNGYVFTDTVELNMLQRTPYKGIIHLPGTIEAENFDGGGNGFTYYDADQVNSGGKYRTTEVDIEASEESGGFQVGYVANGEWLEYSVDVDTAGEYQLNLHAASTASGGTLKVSFGAYASATFTVPSTGSWTKRTIITKNLTLQAGEQIVRLAVTNSVSFNIDRIRFVLITPTPIDTAVVTPIDTSTVANATSLLAKCSVNPNPASDLVDISAPGKASVTVFNSVSTIDKFDIEGSSTYSVKNLAPGLYYFQITTKNATITRQLIKR